MMVLKRKQIVALTLVAMIIVAGYLQYNYNKSSMSAEYEEGRLGEALYVDEDSDGENMVDLSAGEFTVAASKITEDFFIQAKLDREISRSKDTETFKMISQDENAAGTAKETAHQMMISIIENTDIEMRIETLVKEKGFNDVLALIGNDGSVDVIVKSPSLSSAEVAQIADIATRQANIEMSMVYVKNMY